MKQKFKDLIKEVDIRNTSGEDLALFGVSITKEFIKSVANIIGTDLTKYKVVKKNQFVCSLMQVSRDEKIPIALWSNNESIIVSPAYKVFEVVDTNVVLPEYLALWFKREEFDREASYYGVGGVRGSLEWEDFCDMAAPVPSLEEQRKIVSEYEIIENRITIKRQINDNLEAQATTIFKEYVASSTNESSIYDILTVINGAAFSSDYFNTDNIGLPLVRIRDLKSCVPEVWTSEKLSKAEYIHSGDILIGMDGEFVPYIWYGAKSLLNQRVCKVVPKQGVHPFFLYATLKPILAEIERTQGGTTVIHLGKKDFDKMVCFNIDSSKHSEFYKTVEPIYSLIIKNHQEILTLLDVNKSLLSYLSR